VRDGRRDFRSEHGGGNRPARPARN
jgi:hypothetical protein